MYRDDSCMSSNVEKNNCKCVEIKLPSALSREAPFLCSSCTLCELLEMQLLQHVRRRRALHDGIVVAYTHLSIELHTWTVSYRSGLLYVVCTVETKSIVRKEVTGVSRTRRNFHPTVGSSASGRPPSRRACPRRHTPKTCAPHRDSCGSCRVH